MQAIPYHVWKKIAFPLLLFAVFLLLLVFFTPLGFSYGGATRWLHLGFFSIQPSEILKLSLILYLASWLATRRGEVRSFRSAFLPFLTVIAVVAYLLEKQPDIGTLVIILATAVILYFLGGGRVSQLAALGLLVVGGLIVVVLVAPYRMERFRVFLEPALDPQGIGYHISQARIAIGSGGFFGRGYGQGIQKYNYLPETIGDSVFAIVVEEFGFLGAILLSSLFFAFFLRIILIVRRASDTFAKLTAAGIGVAITFQAFVNMAAISGLLPLTGIPLPFISYGGTSLVTTLAMIGIVLNISKQSS
jgi:cell division protein FtsW